ncbi:hypothetical protein PGTUg99_032091 [Puccinia graminis f. sp. tritici]|uniref:Uncharacterized protein n=1 Tax=Puccinia graminis f. sp. tritici TaxID=56615 RepID=A0A5B0PP24_PUCGR|nr:hypothetical protein PGTUg99_032091 [Puccinia graminis f. sp. tritici]
MSQSAYDNHLRKIRQPSKQNSQMIPTATQDTEISSVDQSTNNPSQASPQSLQMSSVNQSTCQHHPTVTPPDESMRSFEFCEPHTLVVMLQAAEL